MKLVITLIILPLAAVHAADGDKRAIQFTGFGPGKMLVESVQQPGETRADKAVLCGRNEI